MPLPKIPASGGHQGRDAIKEENWNRYVRYNGQFAMYAGFLMAALGALDMAVNLSTAIYLLILLGGLAILLYPFAHWMHENEGTCHITVGFDWLQTAARDFLYTLQGKGMPFPFFFALLRCAKMNNS